MPSLKKCLSPFQTQKNRTEDGGKFISSSLRSDPSCSCSWSARQCTPATRCCPAPTSRAPSSRSRSSRPGRRGRLGARLLNCHSRNPMSVLNSHGKMIQRKNKKKVCQKKKRKRNLPLDLVSRLPTHLIQILGRLTRAHGASVVGGKLARGFAFDFGVVGGNNHGAGLLARAEGRAGR